MMRGAWQVFIKELRDALRDRRTLLMVLLSSVALGPVLLVALSALVAEFEARAEARDVYAIGLETAPTLRNFIERQAWTVHTAPADHADALVKRRFEHPVLVVPAGFEADLAAGIAPELLLVSSSANQRAQGSAGSVAALLNAFSQEQASLRLVLRGVPPSALQAVTVQRRDVADPRARAAQFTKLLPFFVLMAVLYGALHAALDTTAGERERGSLEPLLLNPVPRWVIAAGKWLASSALACALAAVAALATEANLKNTVSGAQTNQSNGQFSVHTLTYTVNRADWDSLKKFYLALSARSPYIGIERFTLGADRNDPNMLTLQLVVSSVEIAR